MAPMRSPVATRAPQVKRSLNTDVRVDHRLSEGFDRWVDYCLVARLSPRRRIRQLARGGECRCSGERNVTTRELHGFLLRSLFAVLNR